MMITRPVLFKLVKMSKRSYESPTSSFDCSLYFSKETLSGLFSLLMTLSVVVLHQVTHNHLETLLNPLCIRNMLPLQPHVRTNATNP